MRCILRCPRLCLHHVGLDKVAEHHRGMAGMVVMLRMLVLACTMSNVLPVVVIENTIVIGKENERH